MRDGERGARPGLPALAGLVLVAGFLFSAVPQSELGAESQRVVIEDFKKKDEHGFPVGWEGQRSVTTARKTYRVEGESEEAFLAARNATQRVFKKIGWDPKAKPIVTWRWRLQSPPPEGTDPVAAVFVSLDTDLLVIPVSTKYTWSAAKPKGTTTEGGFFGASEIVLRSGRAPVGEWIQERVNAYEDFKRLHGHEPAPQAWGVSLLGGPGVEVDFGSITVSSP